MDVLTAQESAAVLRRLEALVTALEHDRSPRLLYTVVLLAQEFAGKKKAPFTLAHIRRCLALAHRLLPIRQALLPYASRWAPLTDVLQSLAAELSRLTRLYGVARPACRACNRALQQELRVYFTHATGTVYRPYGPPKTVKEAATIRTFWDDVWTQALAACTATGEAPALDRLLACLPAWVAAHQGRWSPQGWREPSVKEVMQVLADAVRLCEACLAPVVTLATATLAQAPVVDRAQITRDVAPQHAAPLQALQAQLTALPRPKDTPKAQHAALRQAKARLQQDLEALRRAHEAAIQRQVSTGTNYRRKLELLVTQARGQRDTLLRRVGKASVDVFPRMIWVYEYERRGDDDWRTAQHDAKHFFRALRQARAPAGGRAAP